MKMLDAQDGIFIDAADEKDGNLAYRVQEGNAHDGNAALQYIYNGLIWLWAEEVAFADDQLMEVIAKMKEAEVVVIGSPLYWHNICGSVRNVLDRFYGLVKTDEFSGRKLYFLFQGASPEKWMMEAGEGETVSCGCSE